MTYCHASLLFLLTILLSIQRSRGIRKFLCLHTGKLRSSYLLAFQKITEKLFVDVWKLEPNYWSIRTCEGSTRVWVLVRGLHGVITCERSTRVWVLVRGLHRGEYLWRVYTGVSTCERSTQGWTLVRDLHGCEHLWGVYTGVSKIGSRLMGCLGKLIWRICKAMRWLYYYILNK